MKGCLGAALKIFAGLVILVIAAIVFVLSGFYDIHVRYRLTVEVQDGNQIKTGSSVVDASYNIQPDYLVYAGYNTRPGIEGYAPTVDLGEKGLLFLTFVNADRTPDQIRVMGKALFCAADDIWCLPFAAYDKPGAGVGTNTYSKRKAELSELLRSNSGPRDVPFVALPQLMRFVTVNGERRYVDLMPDDLAASFGPGVQLKRVVLQLTDDPVTPQPQIWPQWLKESGDTYVGTLKGAKSQ
jgi:hypothetical protein